MQGESPQIIRKNRFASIRASLQQIPVMKKNTISIQNKLTKLQKRKQSLQQQDINITQSQINFVINKQNQQVKCMGKFAQKYELGEKVGEGSNGLVRKCYLKTTGELFAVKTIMLDDQHIMFLKSNFKFIKSLDHPNIIRYHVMYLDIKKNICYLVMDYNQSPSLLNFLNLSQNQIRHIAYQLVSTLAYVHSENICHRDIKPQNILYDTQTKKITIIDFGISKKIQERGRKKQMLTITGTLYYRAPQMFLGGGYDEKVDLWAAGVTLYQLIQQGKTPFQSQYLSSTIQNITRGEIQYNEEIWKNYSKFAKDLISRLLKKPAQRLMACEAKKHFWFSDEQQQDCLNNIALTRSDFGMKLHPHFISKNSSADANQVQFKLERSLTNTRWSIGMGGSANNKSQKIIDMTAMKKPMGILSQWLGQSDEQDVMIEVESDDENNDQKLLKTQG